MKSSLHKIIAILLLSFSLAMLPHVGLPYHELRLTALVLDNYGYGYDGGSDTQQFSIFLPMVCK
jgi:hypothetical protein